MSCRRKNDFRLFRGQGGFSLFETVLAVFLIGLAGVGFLRAIDANARATRVLDEQVQATNLVTAYLEGIRQMDYSDNISPYNTVGTTVTAPPGYDIDVDFMYGSSLDGFNITWVTWADRTNEKLQRIIITVFRTNGELVLTTCTFRANR